MLQGFYLVSEFAALSGVKAARIYREISSKNLKVIKWGKQILIPEVEAERWLTSVFREPSPQKRSKKTNSPGWLMMLFTKR